jgi:Rrf2 family protein
MLGLTRKGEYAIRGLVYLARQPAGRLVLIQEIAAEAQAPASFLAKILQDFVKGGFVQSARGSGGGFILARPAESITLRQLVEVIEGPILPNRCLSRGEVCGRQGGCKVHDVWRRVQQQMVDTLDQVTLAQMAD